MPPTIASVVFVLGILGLFWLNRDEEVRTSKALWIPVAWMLIVGSRSVSQWLEIAPETSNANQYLEGSALDRVILTGLLAAGIIVLLRRGRQIKRLLQANVPIILFFLYCGLSIYWSDYPEVAFRRWTKALGDLAMIMVILTDLDPSAAIKRLLARTSFLLIPISVLLIKYYPDFGRAYTRWTWAPVFTGVTTNKNILGMICLIFGLGSLWRFLQAFRKEEGHRKAGSSIAQAVLLGMVLWLFWMANSVTALSCFLMAGGLMVATSIPALARKPWVVHLLVAAMLSVSLSVLFFDVSPGLLKTFGRNPTLTGRTELWNRLLGMTTNPFFGVGFESFWLPKRLEKLWSIYWWHPNEAHNGYLEVFLNLGWTGVALLAAIIVTSYRRMIRAFGWDPVGGQIRLAYFVTAVTYSFTEAGFRTMDPVWIFFLLVTAAVPEVPMGEGPSNPTQRGGAATKLVHTIHRRALSPRTAFLRGLGRI